MDDLIYVKRLISVYYKDINKYFLANVETILLFKRDDFEDYLKKWVKSLIDANFSHEKLAALMQIIKNKFDCFKKSPSIMSLVEFESVGLKENVSHILNLAGK